MKKKLGEILVEQGSVSAEDVQAALDAQSGGDPHRLGDLLLQWAKVTPVQLARALCAQSGLPYVQLEQVSPDVAALVSMEVQKEYGLVPFKQDGPTGAVHVAVADPTTKDVLAEIEVKVGRSLKISIASRDEIEAVHRALQGDVLDAEVVVAEPAPPPAPAPAPAKAALGRVALKRVAVVSHGGIVERSELGASPVATTGKVPAFAAEVPELELKPAARPRASAPPASSYHPTVEVALPVPAAKASAPPPGVLPPRASRGTGRTTGKTAPPVLAPAAAKPPPAKPPDDWSVRPAAAAIPKTRPPPALDPFSNLPTEDGALDGPRDYVPPAVTPKKPAASIAPLSALDADPELHERLKDPDEIPLGRDAGLGTRVEFSVPPPPPLLSPSGDPAPPPRRSSPREKQIETDAAFPSVSEPPVADELQDSSLFEPLEAALPTIMTDTVSPLREGQLETHDAAAPTPMVSPAPDVPLALDKPVSTMPQYAVPSGRNRQLETQLQFEPPESTRAKLKTDPEASPMGSAAWKKATEPGYRPPAAPDDEISIDGDGEEVAPVLPREGLLPTQPSSRTESLEFVPPAESAPRPGKPSLSTYVPPPPKAVDAEELAPPVVPPLAELEAPATAIDLPAPVPITAAPSRPRPMPPPPASAPSSARSATPPGGVPIVAPKPAIDETVSATPPEGHRAVAPEPERPPLDTTSAATPPEGNRALAPEVIAAVSPPPEVAPPPPAVEPESLPPEPAPASSLELPSWMRETAGDMPAVTDDEEVDTVTSAVTQAGAPQAIARLLKLLVKRGLLTEEEVLEELKKK